MSIMLVDEIPESDGWYWMEKGFETDSWGLSETHWAYNLVAVYLVVEGNGCAFVLGNPRVEFVEDLKKKYRLRWGDEPLVKPENYKYREESKERTG